MKRSALILMLLVGLTAIFISIWTLNTKSRWENKATAGLSDSEIRGMAQVYLDTVKSFDAGWLGINFYMVHEDNAVKFHDNLYYQSKYIGQVGYLQEFSIRDYDNYKLFLWVNYYPKNPSVNLSNALEFFKAFIIAAKPMIQLSDRYDWFAVEHYDALKTEGIKFPDTIDSIQKDLPYKQFKKYPVHKDYSELNTQSVERWLRIIANEASIEEPSLLIQMITIHKNDLETLHRSAQVISESISNDGGKLIKYSFREHEDHRTIMWVSSLPRGFDLSSKKHLESYQAIIGSSVVYERAIVGEREQQWPVRLEDMPVLSFIQ